MSVNNQDLTKWKVLLEKTFHRRHVKKWREIVIDLLCVDAQLKPALLWDYASLSKESMVHLLATATEKSLLNSSLAVVLIETDLMILSTDSLKGDHSLLDLNHIKAVDVSFDLKSPKVVNHKKLKNTYTVCRDILKNKKDVTLKETDFNPTSLFGLLLGYPIVYWYEMEDEKDGNCLSYQPLRVFKVVGCLETMQAEGFSLTSHTILSFSVPECIVGEFPNSVSEWFENIVESQNWKSLFRNLHLEEETVTLPSVCL